VLTVNESNQRKIKVIYQDDFLLVVNKPGGLVVLRTPTSSGMTLQDWIDSNFPARLASQSVAGRQFASDFAGRSGIVHRLDKDTWGLILIAKNEKVFNQLQRQFKERKVEKTYWALVRGKLLGEGKVVAPIGRLSWDRLKFGVAIKGKQAETNYRAIRQLKIGGDDYTLVVVKPKTGRTHQIRAHFRYLGHPIFGDSAYGGKKEQGKPMFLIAKKIKFFHPGIGQKVGFEVKLPKELTKIITDV